MPDKKRDEQLHSTELQSEIEHLRAELGQLQLEVARQKKMIVHGTCWCGATFKFTADHADTNCKHLDVDSDAMHGYTWDVKINASFEAWVRSVE